MVEHIVRTAPDHLTEGGVCQVLANWVIARDVPWDERLGGWLGAGCDALVVQREVVDPAEYVELWLKDSGHHGAGDYATRYDTWLSWLEDQGVEGIGFGWVNLRRVDRERHGDLPRLAVRRGAAGRAGPARLVRGRATRWPPTPTSPACGWSGAATSSRRPWAHPARRTRRASSYASSAACAGPAPSTPSRRR